MVNWKFFSPVTGGGRLLKVQCEAGRCQLWEGGTVLPGEEKYLEYSPNEAHVSLCVFKWLCIYAMENLKFVSE